MSFFRWTPPPSFFRWTPPPPPKQSKPPRKPRKPPESMTTEARARITDPITSHIAAANLPTDTLNRMFYNACRVHGRLTTTEIANIYGMERDSFSPRPPALIRNKLIVQDGTRWCRNKSGKLVLMIAFRIWRPSDEKHG